jgi:hypothetical protein
MGDPIGQRPPNVFSDFEWARQNRQALLEKYGECSILVYNQKVIGVGPTYKDALENAEQNLAPDVEKVTPIHERLRYDNPFQRVRPTIILPSDEVERK